MADGNPTSRMEKRKVSQKEMRELSEYLAAMAASKGTRNHMARTNLLLGASLIAITAFEHPNGLEVEVFNIKK